MTAAEIPNAGITATNRYNHRLRSSFPFYLRELWAAIEFDKNPMTALTPADIDMAHWAGHGPRLRQCIATRGVGKTLMFSCGLPGWFWLNNPDMNILVISKTQDQAKKTVHLCREWTKEVSFLRHLRPKDTRENRNSVIAFDVGARSAASKDPSMSAVGITGQIPGTRAHLIIGDDIETPDNTKTVNARDELYQKAHEFTKVVQPYRWRFPEVGGELLLVGTYHHPTESVYTRLNDGGIKLRTYPGAYPTPDQRKRIVNLAPILSKHLSQSDTQPGDPVFNPRIGREALDGMMEGIMPGGGSSDIAFAGRSHGDMQVMCMTGVSEATEFPLHLEELMVPRVDLNPFKAPLVCKWGTHDSNHDETYNPSVECIMPGYPNSRIRRPAQVSVETVPLVGNRMHVDPAGGGPDETAWAVGGFAAGLIHVFKVDGFGGSYDGGQSGTTDECLIRIATNARDFNVRVITIENANNGEAMAQLLRPFIAQLRIEPGDPDWPQYPEGWNCAIELSRVRRELYKEQRIIAALEPLMNQHRIVVDASCLKPTDGLPISHELQYQIAAITKEKGSLRFDDRVDALSELAFHFMHRVNVSQEQHAERLREKAFEDEIKKWRRETEGFRPQKRAFRLWND